MLTKVDFARRYAQGEFGNASPTWVTPEDLLEWGLLQTKGGKKDLGLFHLRNGVDAGGETHYKQTFGHVLHLWHSKPKPQDWYASQQIPPHVESKLLIQGEVVQSYNQAGLDLYYTHVPKPMREALKDQAKQTGGIKATRLLQHFMDPNSYEWLMVLLDRYPYHVVEFSTFDCQWGTLPGYNTIFWEVRSY